MTRFADTESVSVGSAVSTGVNESLCDSFAHQNASRSGDVNESEALVRTSESRSDSEDVDSECPTPTSLRPRERMFHDAFRSLSASNPHDGHECSRTHNGLSVSTPHDAHSLVVPRWSTATKCVPSRPSPQPPPRRTRWRSNSTTCEGSLGASVLGRHGVGQPSCAVVPNCSSRVPFERVRIEHVLIVRARRRSPVTQQRFRLYHVHTSGSQCQFRRLALDSPASRAWLRPRRCRTWRTIRPWVPV